jgi:arylsulfatase A-like enzyme
VNIAALAAAIFLACATGRAAEPLPNIVVIVADDLGNGDVGCYGATHVKTPNIDRLAQEGLRLTDAHSTASVCTPTRFALLTGRYAWRQPGTGIAPGDSPALIPPGTVTLASLLKQAGYRTGLVGKWHLGLGTGRTDFNVEIKPGPLELGFDEAFFLPATGDRVPCVYIENHRVVGLDPSDPIRVSYGERIGDEPIGSDPGVKLKIQGGPGHKDTIVNGIPRIGFMTGGVAARWVDEDMADAFTSRAVKFIEASEDRPFFLLFTPHDIHEPMAPNARFRGTSDCGSRGDAIHELDWSVGEILATLDRLGIADKTLVLMSSDNGGAIKDTYDDGTNALHSRQPPNGALRGFKGSLYEGGHRVPMLTRWPGHIPSGATSRALVSLVDLMASFASLTGQTLSAGAGPDSVDVLSALLGSDDAQGRETLVLQNNGQRPLALREGDWVLIEKPAAGSRRRANTGRARRERGGEAQRYELYNLHDDPAQTRDVASRDADRVAAMAAMLERIERQEAD